MNIQEYLRDLLDLLLLENYEIDYLEQEGKVSLHINVSEEDSGILIGRHGETLAAIQRVIRTVFAKQLGERRLTININDYRDQRDQKIRALLERGLQTIGSSDKKYYLYRLNSAERFFVHNLIANDEAYLSYHSYSVDDEDGSRVLVIERKLSS